MTMPYTCRDICAQVDVFAPPRYALEGDPIGLHLGSPGQEVRRLFLALELTPEVAREAMDSRPDMIIVHHTPFFKPFKQMLDDEGHDRIVLELIRGKIALFTAHTNLDCVRGGVNDALARRLGVLDAEILQPLNQYVAEAGLGRIGRLKAPMALSAFVSFAERELSAVGMRYCGERDRRIQKVAVCGGAGAFLMEEALAKGADAFVTADVKHHEGVQALELGLALIDGGHFATENPVIAVLAAHLKESLPDLAITISTLHADPFTTKEERFPYE